MQQDQHQAPAYCNHTSVGILVERDGAFLFFRRVKFPFGCAAPAGHVDELISIGQPDEAAIYEQAASRELEEEVGLVASSLTLVLEAITPYPCRRIPIDGGTPWHKWRVYRAEVDASQTSRENVAETRNLQWLTKEQLQEKAARTARYLVGQIPEEEWQADPGLEPVWMDFVVQLRLIKRPSA